MKVQRQKRNGFPHPLCSSVSLTPSVSFSLSSRSHLSRCNVERFSYPLLPPAPSAAEPQSYSTHTTKLAAQTSGTEPLKATASKPNRRHSNASPQARLTIGVRLGDGAELVRQRGHCRREEGAATRDGREREEKQREQPRERLCRAKVMVDAPFDLSRDHRHHFAAPLIRCALSVARFVSRSGLLSALVARPSLWLQERHPTQSSQRRGPATARPPSSSPPSSSRFNDSNNDQDGYVPWATHTLISFVAFLIRTQ